MTEAMKTLDSGLASAEMELKAAGRALPSVKPALSSAAESCAVLSSNAELSASVSSACDAEGTPSHGGQLGVAKGPEQDPRAASGASTNAISAESDAANAARIADVVSITELGKPAAGCYPHTHVDGAADKAVAGDLAFTGRQPPLLPGSGRKRPPPPPPPPTAIRGRQAASALPPSAPDGPPERPTPPCRQGEEACGPPPVPRLGLPVIPHGCKPPPPPPPPPGSIKGAPPPPPLPSSHAQQASPVPASSDISACSTDSTNRRPGASPAGSSVDGPALGHAGQHGAGSPDAGQANHAYGPSQPTAALMTASASSGSAYSGKEPVPSAHADVASPDAYAAAKPEAAAAQGQADATAGAAAGPAWDSDEGSFAVMLEGFLVLLPKLACTLAHVHSLPASRPAHLSRPEPVLNSPSWGCQRLHADLPLVQSQSPGPAGHGHDCRLHVAVSRSVCAIAGNSSETEAAATAGCYRNRAPVGCI